MYFIRPACICSVVTLLLFLRHRALRWRNGPTARTKNGLRIFVGPTTICTPNEPWTPSRNTAVNDIVQRRRYFRHVNHEFWIVT